MPNKKIGDTIIFENPPSILCSAAVAGKKESKGPLADCFDEIFTDTTLGEKCWEKSETALQQACIDHLLKKAKLKMKQIDILFAGDLQNQCTASAYGVRGLDVQFSGLYGACSTMAQSLCLASCMVAGKMAEKAIALTSSHFCTAERQFRTPLDYGGQRTPTAQWTVTGSGSCIVESHCEAPFVKAVTFGRVQDFGVTDVNNMGAAMAPAAASTLLRYFADTQTKPTDFDCIYTGDLGDIGSKLLSRILSAEGIALENHQDCGLLIYDINKQDVGVGGSGCGCGASVLCGHIIPLLKQKKAKRVLFVATGALMSPTTTMQKESIPCIAHLVELCAE